MRQIAVHTHGIITMLKVNRLEAETRELASFKERAMKQIPGLDSLSIQSSEWLDIKNDFEQQSIRHITQERLLSCISGLRRISYENLVAILRKEQPARIAKVNHESFQSPLRRRMRHPDDEKDIENNPLILSKTTENNAFHSPLSKTGVRICDLIQATPEHGYTDVKTTPGGTKVHSVYSNTKASLYKPLTHYKDTGMVNTTEASHEKLTRELSKTNTSRPQRIHFTATRNQLLLRKYHSKRRSQYTLMNGTCREVFEAHGIETKSKTHGSHYHWSHLIAHFLGGAHSRDNIVPGTAVSNYNTLQLVEEFIARKLVNDCVLSINIQVDPSFSGVSLIPDELQFHLSWEEKGKHHSETITINPRSYQRATALMQSSIGILREFAKEDEPDLGLSAPIKK